MSITTSSSSSTSMPGRLTFECGFESRHLDEVEEDAEARGLLHRADHVVLRNRAHALVDDMDDAVGCRDVEVRDARSADDYASIL